MSSPLATVVPFPCDCPAYDPEYNHHAEDQHTTCNGNAATGDLCGGCDSCMSAQVLYWQRRREQQVCPDPDGHRRDNSSNETVRRLKAEGRYTPAPAGFCDYCGFRVPR